MPYYNNLRENKSLNINRDNIKETIKRLPVLTKRDIINNYDKLINQNFTGKSHQNYSGGSTGVPVKILQDDFMINYSLAAAIRSDRWAGWDYESSIFKFWGASKDFGASYKENLKRLFFKQYMFDAFNWNKDTIIDIYKLMGKIKPNIILAYSSAIYFYVKTVKEKGLKSNHYPIGIITSADMLYDYQREEIEEYFRCKVFNRYGCREVGLIACECEEHEGMHISSDRIYLEVVDENNNQVQDGEVGRILITDLTNTAMPIIRYEIGDMGAISNEKNCKCGRGFPKLKCIEGRITDYIVTNNGKYINGAALTTLIPKLNNIEQLQLIQREVNKVIIKVIRRKGYSKEDEIDIRNKLKSYLGSDMILEFEYVDSLINKNSGKYRFIINEL